MPVKMFSPKRIVTPPYGRTYRRTFNERLRALTAAFLVAILIFYYTIDEYPFCSTCDFAVRDLWEVRVDAGNDTLGFHKILALSYGPSWRTRGLIAAAEYTGLDIEIPKQTHPTPELVEAFQKIPSDTGKQPSNGSAYAWLAHLDLLKYVITNNLETTLIVEDDVDWDLNIKEQMRLISDNIRRFTEVNSTDSSPYGHSWDILWIGHCGERTETDTHRIEYDDSAVLPAKVYTGWSNKYMFNIDAGRRAIQEGVNPVCTFGYAVTLKGAEKVLHYAGKGGNEAFDIRLLQGCQAKDLDCLVVNPEVMHHYTPSKELGYASSVYEGDGKGSSSEESQFENIIGGTENILRSARCRVLFGSTCLKDHRDY
ncbi:hypothetical protein HYFRA_00011349 [Hymenoscyphus fraxineus]|uniref:Glycosyltransferase family 25 protein n=1 Tax=Hymenoscyphus fraxineus TaxID=746836 RepID=A0A9N9L098_9HELO|nr:hypothetical protein HYFRA_00011349 [Hymenoscyphus fraxineus]